MKCISIFAPILAFLMWSGCQPSAPSPAQQGGERAQPAAPSFANDSPSKALAEPSNFDNETAVCQAVMRKIYHANGDASYPVPTVILSENTSCMAAFFPRKNTVEIERRAYAVCRSFGADSLSALAFMLGHEFSHALDAGQQGSAFRSNFWAYSGQPGSSAEQEKNADLRGAFMAHLAGYRILSIVPALIKQLYAAYPEQNPSAGYPSETERQHTAIQVQGLVDTMIQVFEAANYLLATGQSDMAAVCYDHVLQTYHNPEIWNNFGIACALEALQLPGSDGWVYPFELDWQLRLSRPRGAIPTDEQLRKREMLLQRSKEAFAAATRLAPHHFFAQANAWCVGVIAGDALAVRRAMEHFSSTSKMSRVEAERWMLIHALAAARSGNTTEAEQTLADLSVSADPGTAALARYNKDVLKNGGNQAALPDARSPCPASLTGLDLPSVLTLRRMAVPFEGLSLGKNAEMTLSWEDNARGRLLKARMGADRFCILRLAPVQRAMRLPATFPGLNGPSGSRLCVCDEQYLLVFQGMRLTRCGVFYAYRAANSWE